MPLLPRVDEMYVDENQVGHALPGQDFGSRVELALAATNHLFNTQLLTHSSLTGAAWDPAAGSHTLQLRHEEKGTDYVLDSDAVVLATGYTYREPGFLAGIQGRIARDSAGRFAVARNYSTGVEPGELFAQNAELHTHGFVTPDLGMAAYRNSCILREITGREVYPVEHSIAFQQFGAPDSVPTAAGPVSGSVSGPAGLSAEPAPTQTVEVSA